MNGQAWHAEADQMAHDPQPGDRWTEMLANWTYVVWREGDRVWWLNSAAPCTFPEDGKGYAGLVEDFAKWVSYKTSPGYWCRSAGRGHNVAGWYTAHWGE